ncbi:MAG: PhnD/SsuA/transferrin family substrate-binding protein [Candidatus Thiodiazotropha sp.]
MSFRRLFVVTLLSLLWLLSGSVLSATQTYPNPPIQVGGSADGLHDSTVTDAEIGFKLIFNELLAKGAESFETKIYDSNDKLLEDFKNGKLQALFVSSLKFIELGDLIHPTGRYAVQFGPSLKQRYLILVRREQEGFSLADLRDKKLSMAKGHVVGKRFLDVTLLKQGLPISDRFFGEIQLVKEVNTAVIDLFFRKADVALVPEFSFELARELNPQISSSITAIATSEPLVYMLAGMRYDFPKQRLDNIEPYILNINHSSRMQHLLKTFRITGIYRVDEETLKEVKTLNEAYRKFTQHSP